MFNSNRHTITIRLTNNRYQFKSHSKTRNQKCKLSCYNAVTKLNFYIFLSKWKIAFLMCLAMCLVHRSDLIKWLWINILLVTHMVVSFASSHNLPQWYQSALKTGGCRSQASIPQTVSHVNIVKLCSLSNISHLHTWVLENISQKDKLRITKVCNTTCFDHVT